MAFNIPIKRCGNITTNQKELMVAYMEQNPQLKSGKFSPQFTFKIAQNLWRTLSSKLNNMPGATKDWKQWRKTWQDLRTKTKSKTAKYLKQQRNGGGDLVHDELEITPMQCRIMGMNALTQTIRKNSSPKSKKKPIRAMKLDDTICETMNETTSEDQTIYPPNRLEDIAEKKLKIQEKYFQRKLELYEEDIKAKNRIAAALETISTKLQNRIK